MHNHIKFVKKNLGGVLPLNLTGVTIKLFFFRGGPKFEIQPVDIS